MMMGGGLFFIILCLLPLLALGALAVAVIGMITGRPVDIYQWLIPARQTATESHPASLPDPEEQKLQGYAPLGVRQADHPPALDYVRTCQECGEGLERRWEYCPACGTKLYWV
jgi:hypothetical protein